VDLGSAVAEGFEPDLVPGDSVQTSAGPVGGTAATTIFFDAFLTGGLLFAAFDGKAFSAAFLTAPLFRTGVAFFAVTDFLVAALAARAFFRFAISLALVADESFRLGFTGSGVGSSTSPLTAAHLFL
jgi:hypothetical protein